MFYCPNRGFYSLLTPVALRKIARKMRELVNELEEMVEEMESSESDSE